MRFTERTKHTEMKQHQLHPDLWVCRQPNYNYSRYQWWLSAVGNFPWPGSPYMRSQVSHRERESIALVAQLCESNQSCGGQCVNCGFSCWICWKVPSAHKLIIANACTALVRPQWPTAGGKKKTCQGGFWLLYSSLHCVLRERLRSWELLCNGVCKMKFLCTINE